MRRIYAEIELDEEIADRYAEVNGLSESAPIPLLEKEFPWLHPSGFSLVNAVVADADDDSLWFRYLAYLMEWALSRSYDDEPESPLSWESYKERELNGPVMLVGPRFAKTLIDDLGNGEPTHNGERTSRYHVIAKGKGEKEGRACNVALVERTVGYRYDKDYYELHVINDIDMCFCKTMYTESMSEKELYALLEYVLNKIEHNEVI